MKVIILIISLLIFPGYSKNINIKQNTVMHDVLNKKNIKNSIYNWHRLVKIASNRYHVETKLIESIIYAESSGNPYAKSHSNAIGLMQIKPSAAGIEIYRLIGKKGQPSIQDLYDPEKNINIGTAYIQYLQKKNCLE